MDLDQIRSYMRRADEARLATATQKAELLAQLPAFIASITPESIPARLVLPTGETVRSATRMTAVRCHCLLLARRVFGSTYYKVAPEFEALAREMLFDVMREYYVGHSAKGFFCCATCTLSLMPLYALNSFRYIDCAQAYRDVRTALDAGSNLFQASYPVKYADWSRAACRRRAS